MAFSISTHDFPSIRSYADAREHYDSIKTWRNARDRNVKPLGTRSHKHKNMRSLMDGSIVFCLYQTDCVTWHPDNSITIQGYDTMSTTAFVNSLIPSGISHAKGCKHDYQPVLWLSPPDERYWLNAGSYESLVRNPDYGKSTQIIQCSRPVTLNYNVASKTWLPRDVDALEPFTCYRVDRNASRAVSREYNLPTLSKVLNAVAALVPSGGYQSQRTAGGVPMAEIMAALREERYVEAVELFPRGDSFSFGKWHGSATSIQPGFLQRLRDHIYDHEGVVETFEQKMLSPSQYKRMIADAKRYY